MHFFNFKYYNNHNEINLLNVDEKRYKYGNLLIFACFFLYTASMAAKGVFAAQMKFIVGLWNLEYATASMANTYYFVAYGLVQVGLFFFMNKFSMRKYLLWTVPVAAISTALIGVATRIEYIWIYFGISGAFQAGIYAGCNLMLTRYLPVKLLSKANTMMSLGYAVGSVAAYAFSALCISMGGEAWRVPYFVFAGIFLLAIITFGIIVYAARRFARVNGILDKKLIERIKAQKQVVVDDSVPLITIKSKGKMIIFYVVDLIMSFLITALYYCVMNYITSLLVDVHGISEDVSIYISIIAPVAIAIGPILTIRACDKHKDFVRQAILFSLILLPIPLIMAFYYDLNVIFALALSVVFVVVANGIKSIAISIMAFKLRMVINAGSYSAISNAVASVAAGVAPTVIGAIIDNAGWKAAYLTTFAVAAFVVVALIIIDIIVRKDYRKENNMRFNEKI